MFDGSLPAQSRRSTYIDTLELTDLDTGEPIAASLINAVTVSICRTGRTEALLSASLGSGVTLPADGVIEWRFEASALAPLLAGPHRLLVSVTSGDQVLELLDAILPLT